MDLILIKSNYIFAVLLFGKKDYIMKKAADYHNIDLAIISELKKKNWVIAPLNIQIDERDRVVGSSINISKLNIHFVLHPGTREVEAYFVQQTPQGPRSIPLLFLNDHLYSASAINSLYSSFIKNFKQKN